MGKKKSRKSSKAGRRQWEKKDSEEESGNEVDPNSRDVMFDDVDDFHEQRDCIPLDSELQNLEPASDSDDEEVLALSSTSSDEEGTEGRDIEEVPGDESDGQSKDVRGKKIQSWGKKKSAYYINTKSKQKQSTSLDDLALRLEEAKKLEDEINSFMAPAAFCAGISEEALEKMRRRSEQAEASEEEQEDVQKFVLDVTRMSKEEQLSFMKNKHPHVLPAFQEIKERMHAVKSIWNPLVELARGGKIPAGMGCDYVRMKQEINLTLCANLSFYLTLATEDGSKVSQHPINKRLKSLRKQDEMLAESDKRFSADVKYVLKCLEEGKEVKFLPVSIGTSKKEAIPVTTTFSQDVQESKHNLRTWAEQDDGMEDFKADIDERAKRRMEAMDSSDEGNNHSSDEAIGEEKETKAEDNEKRPITYQIAKNKLISKKRKKEQRNPRVKHRRKFEKAKVRRKSTVKLPRTEMQRYGGELSIRTGLVRSVKHFT